MCNWYEDDLAFVFYRVGDLTIFSSELNAFHHLRECNMLPFVEMRILDLMLACMISDLICASKGKMVFLLANI